MLPANPWWKFWNWPEYALKVLREWYETAEAKHKADKAKIELQDAVKDQVSADRERAIKEMMWQIQRTRNDCQEKHKGRHVVPTITPSPEDDPEIFLEAMRRLDHNEAGHSHIKWPPRWRA